MAHNAHHDHLIVEVEKLFKPILDRSPHAIYIYLDDEHKICNKKFAALLGYKSVAAWVKNLYPLSDVQPKDQNLVVKAYSDASEKFKASTIKITFTNKVKATVTMVPFTYQNEVFVVHFISKVQ